MNLYFIMSYIRYEKLLKRSLHLIDSTNDSFCNAFALLYYIYMYFSI